MEIPFPLSPPSSFSPYFYIPSPFLAWFEETFWRHARRSEKRVLKSAEKGGKERVVGAPLLDRGKRCRRRRHRMHEVCGGIASTRGKNRQHCSTSIKLVRPKAMESHFLSLANDIPRSKLRSGGGFPDGGKQRGGEGFGMKAKMLLTLQERWPCSKV